MNVERNNGLNRLRGLGRLAAMGYMLLTAGFAASAKDLSAWQKRMPIAFSGYTPPGGGETLTNFPVLVVLSNTIAGVGFNYNDFLAPPYGDLRFVAADKTTPLDFEVESWDTNGLAHVWVRVPELTTNTTIYALWGKSSVSVPACTTNGTVWDANYKGVWHLAQTNTMDSTTNRRIATSKGNTNAVGLIGMAQGFSGANSYVDLGATPLLPSTAPWTISGWMNPTNVVAMTEVFAQYLYAGGNGRLLLRINADKEFDLFLGDDASHGSVSVVVGKVSLNTWSCFSFSRNGANFAGYLNGVQVATSSDVDANRAILQVGNLLGARCFSATYNLNLGDFFPGFLDEFRVSHITRSSNWIWASYLNTASNDVFVIYGVPEYQDLPGVGSSGWATNVTTSSAWLNGTLSSTGTSDTAVFAYWGPVDGGTNASDWANTNIWVAPQTPSDFTIQATSLSADSTYYYRFSASNALGWAWASEASLFITGEVWIDKLSDASEIGPTPGTFTVHRAAAATNEAVTVTYTVGGTATPGVDYTALSGTVTIPAGETNAVIEVLPIFDHLLEGPETVEVTLVLGPYVIGITSNATVEIADYGVVARTWGGGGANSFASNPDNWVEGEALIAGDAIVLGTNTSKNMTWDLNLPVQSWTQDGYTGTVTIATVYPGQGSFTNFTVLGDCVISNGRWTHTANPVTVTNLNNEQYRLRVTVGGDLTIGPEGQINVYGCGYTSGKGPGSLPVGVRYYGGSYGGRGGRPCYGSVVTPVNLGGGGTSSSGGGAVFLTVGGTLLNNGSITANGRNVTDYRAGAGGSIYAVAGKMAGGGVFQAAGGGVVYNTPGAGGRVALVVTNSGADFGSFTGSHTAFGGPIGAGASGGVAGTVYLETASDPVGQGHVIVDNKGYGNSYVGGARLNEMEAVTYAFSRITLTNNALLTLAADNTLVISNTALHISPVDGGLVLNGGALLTTDSFVWSNYFIRITAPGSTFSPTDLLTIGTNAILWIDQPHVMNGDLTIAPGGLLTHTATPSGDVEPYKLDLTVYGNLIVESGGNLDVTGRGYRGGTTAYGPGTPLTGNAGASHGGQGANGLACYGSIVAPTNQGSGGRGVAGTHGGGAIRLAVDGELRNDGGIRANATEITVRTGAGGSVSITCGALRGSGPIQANSATNVTSDRPGGGGRVAVAVTHAGENVFDYAGAVTAYGGRKKISDTSGGAGTVYLRNPGQGLTDGTLIVDNDNLNGLGTEISSTVTDTTVANVFIRRAGNLLLNTNQTLTVSGIWSNSANFTGLTDAAVIFGDVAGSTSTIYGATTFMGLTCTNAGHTLAFAVESTNAVAAYGRLTLRGNVTTNLILRPTIPGTAWHLNVDPLAEQDVEFVDVTDSDAGEGAEIIAKNSVGETQANVHWNFMNVTPGETIIWTGGSNTLWGMVENWSLDRAPVETDVIVIPGGCPNYPAFDAPRTVNRLAIQSGGSISLNGYDLTVTNDATIAGHLIAMAGETIMFQGDADFTGGAFTSVRSTVRIAGTGVQTVNPDDLTFHKILMINEAHMVECTGGFRARELRCEAPSGTRSLRFRQGTTVAVRDLMLLGVAGTTNITLRSSVDGQAWLLKVSGYRSVCGVDVADSDASGGLPILATGSKNSGNTPNWVFEATPVQWLGTKNVSFHTAANWSSAVVPDATTRVLVESANPLTITGVVTVLDLMIGGGAGTSAVTVNGTLTVAENLTLLNNGTMNWNSSGVVSNNVVVQSGGWLTHSANSTLALGERYKLALTVRGDCAVDAGGQIDTTARGYSITEGPGSGKGINTYYGGSYGGLGSGGGPCYGSILAPTNLGSGGNYSAGGGAVLLDVGGKFCVDGTVCANGGRTVEYRSGSGGSVGIVAGALTGWGAIRADGGIQGYGGSGGGGGRISLTVTNAGADFFGFVGTVSANSGSIMPVDQSSTGGGAGTVYRQTGMDRPGRGTVFVENRNLMNTSVTRPPDPNALGYVLGEADRAVFRVSHAARLQLTDDFTVGDIWLDTANAWLDLGSNTLTVNAREHPLGLGTVVNPGAIIWTGLPPGVLIIVK